MNESISKELEGIKHLTIIGKYHEAIKRIDTILGIKELSDKERVRALILQSKCFFMLGRFEFREEYYQKSMELSELVFSISKETDDIISMFEAKIWNLWTFYIQVDFKPKGILEKIEELKGFYNEIKSKEISIPKDIEFLFLFILSREPELKIHTIKNHIWDYKDTIELLDRSLNLATETGNKENMMLVYWYKDFTYIDISEYDNALKFGEEGLRIAEELENEHFVSYFLQRIGMVNWLIGEFNLLLEFITKSLEIREKQENTRGAGYSHFLLGFYYGETGEWKKAQEYFQKGYDILSEKGKRENYNHLLNNIGVCYQMMGNYDEALKTYNIAYEVNKKLGKTDIAYSNLGNMCSIYTEKGDLDKAMELNEEILTYYEKSGNKAGISGTLFRIAYIYYHKGIINKAIENLEKVLVYNQEIGNKTYIISTLYSLSVIASEFNMINEVTQYHEKLVEIAEEIEYRNIKRLALLSEAIILKNSIISRDRVRAEVLFDQILQEDLNFYFHIQVLFHLCDLLLKELKETSDEKILDKLQKNVSKLIEIGSSANLPYLIAEILWFKSQLSLLDLDIEKARKLLDQALQIAEKKGLNRLALKIAKSREQLIKQKVELEELGTESSSISKRMEILKVENGFKKIKNDGRYALNVEKLERTDKLFSIKI
ncbi:MAG: tetratricopeptide repeat protein [Candidatus Heimdallarchaeota archaeon]|nr:tetratricopeptide repeat protein [Candidatus Heimdallarchaeota archaeon]MCK4878045.1 tetratricopeptide repeat protein [Candidatus Heimdallarchaeota archaeon]